MIYEEKQYSNEAFEILKSQLYRYYNKHKDHKFLNLSLEAKISSIKNFANMMIEQFDSQGQINPELLDNYINMLVTNVDSKGIVFEDGYVPWLDENRSSIRWQYNNRYEDYLMSFKRWDVPSIRSIGITTDQILDHCGNPLSNNNFGVKGLVIGDIQSGKTANYTGLINKAIDAGYKFIIVLAGLTKDLRSQTQKRLDLEVLGFETKDNLQRGDIIGVGKVDSKVEKTIFCLTGSDMEGDIKRFTQTYKFDGNMVFLAIVKKNTAVLKKLIEFIQLNPAVKSEEDNKLHFPALIIDDEADQASINTKKTDVMAEATATNRLIRKLLNCLSKYSYVGYTATPFANIFISPYDDPKYTQEDKDIFPENFIICLPTPPNYCGVNQYFGARTLDSEGIDAFTVDLFREITIDDLKTTFGTDDGKTKKDTEVISIPDSLNEAIMHFLIASGIKISRGIIEHNSMLIHISSNVCPNKQLKDFVEMALDNLTRGFKFNKKVKLDFKHYWENNIKPISQVRLGKDYCDKWNKIEEGIIEALRMITRTDTVKVIVGDSEDIIDYDSSKSGMHIIIGGSKLSRGLTLNGLIVSYYARRTKAYDTLLQMGRWFGYRDGWLDLCRVYTDRNTFNDFVNTAEAVEDFKKDIEYMNKRKYTPRQFGLKVRTSPGLLPTSATKMRSAKRTPLSFSGQLQQTISFDLNQKENNRLITANLIAELGKPTIRDHKLIYKNIDSKIVLKYLDEYQECKDKGRISIRYWYEYIQKLNNTEELTKWTIVIHSLSNQKRKQNDSNIDSISNYEIIKPVRITRDIEEKGQKLNIKVLTNPLDFFEFYDDDTIKNAMVAKNKGNYSPEESLIQSTFTKEYGLLTIYIFDIAQRKLKSIDLLSGKRQFDKGDILPGANGVVGLGIWFSESSQRENACIDYFVNEVYQGYEQDQNRATIEEEDFDE